MFGQNVIFVIKMTFKAIFYAKNTKNDKNVSTLWRHYDVNTASDKVLRKIIIKNMKKWSIRGGGTTLKRKIGFLGVFTRGEVLLEVFLRFF